MKFSETRLSTRIQDYFSSRFSVLKFSKGKVVIESGDDSDTVYMVLSGILVAIHQNNDGKLLQLKKFYKNDIVGYYASLSKNLRSATVAVLENADLLEIPSGQFQKFITEDPENAHEMMCYLGGELQDQTLSYKELGLLSVDQRICSYLLRNVNNLNIVNSEQSRQEIADSIGISRETLSRTFSAFEEKGLMRFLNTRSILLSDREAIERIWDPSINRF